MCFVFSALTFDQFFATVFVLFYNLVIFVQNLKNWRIDLKLPPIKPIPRPYLRVMCRW